MVTTKKRVLGPGEIEVMWTNGQIEVIQTEGMVTTNSVAVVAEVRGHKLVIPMTAMRYFRVKAV